MLRRLRTFAPALVFALGFCVVGWLASHCLAYALVDPATPEVVNADRHEHGHGDHSVAPSHVGGHGYLFVLPLPAALALIVGLVLILRRLFGGQSARALTPSGWSSWRPAPVVAATAFPAAVFVAVEIIERVASGAGTFPPGRLLLVGMLCEILVGALVLAAVRFTLFVAERAVRQLAEVPASPPSNPAVRRPRRLPVVVRETSPLATRLAGRAPPLVACALTAGRL